MNLLGEWCSPTREITNTRLIRLIDESRDRAPVAEVVHDTPTHESPASAPESLATPRCNTMVIDPRSLDAPGAPASAPEVVAPDPGLPTLWSEPDVEPATATLMYAPMTTNAMPPTPAPAQTTATGARRGRQRVARIRLLLCLGALTFLCVGLLVVLGLAAWGGTDASLSLGL